MKRALKILQFILLGLILLCLGTTIILALTNRSLPAKSSVVDRLSMQDKAYLEEYFHLRQSLGDQVWQDWSQILIPIIVYNEKYAFLVGYPGEPPAGWQKVPAMTSRGSAWEPIIDDSFLGQTYYRQELTDPNINPEAFTVKVGDTWVSTMGTREFSEIDFYDGFRDDLPGFLKAIFPYRLMWKTLMGNTEIYIGALEHEAFHAFEGTNAPDKLAQAEQASSLESQYPWDDPDLESAWQTELNLLYQAATAETDDQATDLARQFLRQRDQRRQMPGMTAEFNKLEQSREWEEGLAKYAEIEIQRQAALASDYTPTSRLMNDPHFKSYTGSLRYYQQQLAEGKRLSNRSGDTRFYYSGFMQAVLLDRLLPEWKDAAFQPDIWLDYLLNRAIGAQE
jgi:hypothetical protein